MRCDALRATTAAKENCREISSSLNRSSLGSCEVDFGGGARISFMAMKVQAITAGGGVGLLCPLGVGSSGSYSQSCSVQFSVSGRVSAISCRTGGGLSPTQLRVGTKKKLRFLENELLGKQVVSFKSRCPTTHKKPSRFVVRASAVFDNLSSSFEAVWTKLRNQDVLTRENIKEPMQDIRRALLEADVSLPVVRKFVKTVTEKAIGIGVIKGVRPDQQLVKVVNDELITLMGGTLAGIEYAKSGPTVILMAGLQGVGKTTACAKLALYFKKKGKSVMMVATDIYRPAAIDQLVTLGRQVEVPVFEAGTSVKPAEIAKRGLAEAKVQGTDVIIIDTAGRLQVDRGMMDELKDVKRAVSPTEVLLVVDAMTGQEAASLVSAFNLDLGITGAILTKLDGDSRGGAALSVKEVSGKPIKFVGEGESMAALEQFYPDRMASRILGMGDVLSFVEKAQEVMVKEEAEDMQRRIMEAKFDFNDFLKQTRNLARMGSMGGLMKLIPGMNKISPQQIAEAEKSLKVMESMINSMTPKERGDPELLAKSPSRRRRVALGSGRSQEQVSQLVSQLFQMRARMKNLSSMMQGGSIPGLGALEEQLSGRKAPPGTAKRRKPKAGLQVSSPSRSAAKGFGSK